MLANQQPWARANASAQGAERVLAHNQSRLAHPFRSQIGGAAMLCRQKQPYRPMRLGRDRRKLPDHGFGARAQRCGI